MKRRDFITKVGLGTASSWRFFSTPAIAQESSYLRVQLGRDFPGLGVSAQRLMEQLLSFQKAV